MFQEAAQQSRSAPPALGPDPGPAFTASSTAFQQPGLNHSDRDRDRIMSMQIANDESPYSLVDDSDDDVQQRVEDVSEPHMSAAFRASVDRKRLLKQLEHELQQKLSAQRGQTDEVNEDEEPEDNAEPYLDPALVGGYEEAADEEYADADADDVVLTRKLLSNRVSQRKPPPARAAAAARRPRMPHSASNPDLGIQPRQTYAENADPDELLDDDVRYLRDKQPGELVKLARTHLDSSEWYATMHMFAALLCVPCLLSPALLSALPPSIVLGVILFRLIKFYWRDTEPSIKVSYDSIL